MIHLTPEQIDARRLEYAQVEEQIRVLGRRKSILKSEILLGYALPAKGVAPEQLSLDTSTATTTAKAPSEAPAQGKEAAKTATATTTATELDKSLFLPSRSPGLLLPTLTSKGKRAVLALLKSAPGGRLSEEEIRERLRLPGVPMPSECYYQSGDWVLKETPKASKKLAPSKPASKTRSVKPGKAAKKPAAKGEKALWKPSRAPGFLLPSLTAEGNRRALELISAAPGKRMLVSEVRRALDLPDDCAMPNGCYYQGLQEGGTWWGISDNAPPPPAKSVKPAPKAKPAPPAKKLLAPRPTKTIREAKPKILDSYPVETWAEGFYSVVGLINANGLTRGAWLLLHAKPNATVAAEVLDLLEQADLVTTGDTIKLGAVLQADIDAQPGARLGYLLAKRVGEWVCELVASSAKPPTVDTLAKLTGLHRGLFCALLNALEDEGLVKRSKGGGVPVWVVPAQARTLPLIPGVDPAPASEEPCPT